jgi:glycerol-3-phosphate acyltransferase PlsY
MPLNYDLLLRMLGCFAIGAIPFAIISMWGTGIDIRTVGSGNPGFNNVLRVDKKRAILCLIGDLGKGALAVWLVTQPTDPHSYGWAYGFGAVFGHCYSPFLRFNGGKGIATSAGVMLILFPIWAAAAMLFFTLLRLLGSRRKWREAGMVASVSTWVFFTFLMFLNFSGLDARFAALMTVFLAWRHKQYFRNLIRSPTSA